MSTVQPMLPVKVHRWRYTYVYAEHLAKYESHYYTNIGTCKYLQYTLYVYYICLFILIVVIHYLMKNPGMIKTKSFGSYHITYTYEEFYNYLQICRGNWYHVGSLCVADVAMRFSFRQSMKTAKEKRSN